MEVVAGLTTLLVNTDRRFGTFNSRKPGWVVNEGKDIIPRRRIRPGHSRGARTGRHTKREAEVAQLNRTIEFA